ncbi:molybdenum cofactor guanylyltransferase [uncultured Paraglaciecola sp.]|uniref:molybdenum cofactor guanylyltransferase n=1 Tax=uncultured Paraglaciecola sp. TaxID=1765024 RepID=UPI00262565FE|nr:molybdenum cofactor guanylyltransferase [uncultured Paraglaciecola sp.]
MLAGLILAGGRSSRMGTDKSLLTLPHSQETLLQHSQKRLANICNHQVFVSGSTHPKGIADVIPHCGPLSGIHGVIAHIKQRGLPITELLIAAVDMPDLSTEDFGHLLEQGRKHGNICAFEKYYLPLYLPITKGVTAYLNTKLKYTLDNIELPAKNSHYSIKALLAGLQGSEISPLNMSHLNNINTPSQWQSHCARQSNSKV